MKKSIYLFLTILVIMPAFYLTSCNDDDNDAQTYEPQPKEDIEFLNPVLVVAEQNQQAYTSLLGTQELLKFKQLVFQYTSYGPDMKTPVRLTGSVTAREDVFYKTVDPSSIVLYNEFTTAKHGERTSQNEIEDVCLLTIDSKRLIIAADLYGWTLTEDKPQAYCCTEISSKEIIDCYDAAMYLLKQLGYKVDGLPLYNVGYSSGALTAMCAQRYVDYNRSDIKFDKTLVGGGPYDLEGIYKAYVESDTTGYVCSLPLMLVSYKETFGMPYSYQEIFQSPLGEHVEDWILSKNYNTGEINDLIGREKHVSEILTPTAYDTTSVMGRHIIDLFRQNSACGNIKDWQPSKETEYFVYHSKGDLYIPWSIGSEMADYLKDHGCNVTSKFNSSGNHVQWGLTTFFSEAIRRMN